MRGFTKSGAGYIITLGGDPCIYDLKFQLYLQTKITNPHFQPEISA